MALLLVSVAIVLYQYGDPEPSDAPRQLICLGIYAVVSTVVVVAYARRRRPSQAVFYAAVAVALLPLVAVKVWPLVRAATPVTSFPPGVPAAGSGLLDTVGFLGLSYMALRVVDALVALHDGVLDVPPHAADVLG